MSVVDRVFHVVELRIETALEYSLVHYEREQELHYAIALRLL